jgi:flagellar motor switch protein FliN
MTQSVDIQTGASLLEEYAAEIAEKSAEQGLGVRAGAAPPGRAKTQEEARPPQGNLEMVMRIPVTIKVVLGSATMPVANLVKLGRGAIIPLDRKVGEPVDVVVNGRVVARGEVVVVDETTSRFGISLTEIVGPAGTDRAA